MYHLYTAELYHLVYKCTKKKISAGKHLPDAAVSDYNRNKQIRTVKGKKNLRIYITSRLA